MADDIETERHTTVVQTERRGGGGTIAAVILVLLVLLLLFLFRNEIFGAAKQTPDKIDVDISAGNSG